MELQPNHVVRSKYRIDGVLGVGGFATVYSATTLATGEPVALKVLSPDGKPYQPTTRARFSREVELLAQLKNPHTVQLFEHGETDEGLLFMVFEHVSGRDLSEAIEEAGQLPAGVVQHVLTQLLHSLDEAHRAGVIHRDIKPENVRVFTAEDDRWRVKLLDFGIARSVIGEQPAITKTGELVGTPRYMSPEQLLGQPLTARSDIYSLGMVALEMIVGRSALQGNRWADQLDRLQSGYLFSAPGVDHEAGRLHQVIARMTARKADQRHPTAAAVLSDLAGPPAPRARAEEPRMPTTTLAVVAGVLLVVLGLAAVVALWSVSSTPEPDVAVRQLPPQLTAVSQPPMTTHETDSGSGSELPALADGPCGRPAPFVGRGRLQDDFGFGDAPLAYVPAGYDGSEPMPLLFLFHHNWEDPGDLLAATGFERLADEHGFIIIAPYDGEIATWRTDDDLPRVRRHFDRAVETLCVDPKKVFAVGQGAGGRMVRELVCADWITAAATHSYQPNGTHKPCESPAPYIMVSPMKTEKVPVGGGMNCNANLRISLEESESLWRDWNGCHGPAESTFAIKGSECRSWKCEVPFESCHLNGGFGWPGSSQRLSDVLRKCDGEPADFPLAERVWAFFASID